MAFKCSVCGEEDLGHKVRFCWRCNYPQYHLDKYGKKIKKGKG